MPDTPPTTPDKRTKSIEDALKKLADYVKDAKSVVKTYKNVGIRNEANGHWLTPQGGSDGNHTLVFQTSPHLWTVTLHADKTVTLQSQEEPAKNLYCCATGLSDVSYISPNINDFISLYLRFRTRLLSIV